MENIFGEKTSFITYHKVCVVRQRAASKLPCSLALSFPSLAALQNLSTPWMTSDTFKSRELKHLNVWKSYKTKYVEMCQLSYHHETKKCQAFAHSQYVQLNFSASTVTRIKLFDVMSGSVTGQLFQTAYRVYVKSHILFV